MTARHRITEMISHADGTTTLRCACGWTCEDQLGRVGILTKKMIAHFEAADDKSKEQP